MQITSIRLKNSLCLPQQKNYTSVIRNKIGYKQLRIDIMKKLLFIIAVAGFFAACTSGNSQDATNDDKAKTEMTEKKSDCATKEAKSDCDTKEKKTDCCDSKKEKKSDCEGTKTSEAKEAKTGCSTKEKADCGSKGNTPC